MHVQTLGALEAGIKPIKPKNLLLLCYLALEGKQDRKHLQMLFWPEAADPATSLRVALSYLQGLGKDLFRSVQNQVEALIQTDAHELTQFYQQQQYSEVIRLYSGAFLKGLDLKNSSTELEDWIFETREKLASLVQWSVLYEAQKVRYSMPEQFQALAEHFFQIDGAPPPTLEMLRFLYTLGLEGYLEHRVLKEAAELGVDLTTLQVPQKTNLQTAIRPVQVFVGRDQELQLLHERLQQIPPAIVTITGLGGVGKSTLVRAYCAEHHPENTLWLKADGLKDASGLLHQLGLNVQQADPWVGLTDTLRYHKGIVVIDGADQLSGLDHLQNWLRFPDLRVIVTCRQPLQLAEESLLKLEPFSIQEYRGMGLSEVMNHPAVQCFEKHAKRNHAAFKIRPEDAQDVVHLCAALSGLPLALEMASSWTQILSLKELREEVQQVVDPEGDPQSLKPIFEASWNLLSEQEKQALTNLNCFLGSFTREAAVIVSGVQLRTLQQLVRKSLLQLEPGQRFRVPQVLKGFIPEPGLEIRQKYEDYHLHLLNMMEVKPSEGLIESSGAVPDLMEVVRQTVRQEIPRTLPLLRLFETPALRFVGLQFYSDLVRNLNVLLAPQLFIEYAWICLWTGMGQITNKICDSILNFLKDEVLCMQALNMKGLYMHEKCRYMEAEEYISKAYRLALSLKDESRILSYGFNLSWLFIQNNKIDNIEKLINDVSDNINMEDSYMELYYRYFCILYQAHKYNHINIIHLDEVVEATYKKQFYNLYLYALSLKVGSLLGNKRFDGLSDLTEKGLHECQNYEIPYIEIQFHLNGFRLRCEYGNFDSLRLHRILYIVRENKDIYNLINLILVLGEYGMMDFDRFLHLPLSENYASAYQREKLQQLRITHRKSSLQVNTSDVQPAKITEMVLDLFEWLVLMDHQRGREDHLHPHPEGKEVLHLLEPHPTSREQSL